VAGRVVVVAVVRFQVVSGYGGEAKRRRRRLREGKGGGGREASGPVRRRGLEAYSGTRCGRPSGGVRVLRAGGRRRSSSLTGWAHLSVRGRRRSDWAGKGGRRWATAGLEKKGGGRAKTISRAEIQ
jgi:hypothetical protein